MKENKPILFINSAQSDSVGQGNQYVYDSRFKNREDILKKPVKKEVPIKEPLEEPVETVLEETTIEEDVLSEVEEPVTEDEEFVSPFDYKIGLLNRRAEQGHFVVVEVTTKEKTMQGLFYGRKTNQIILKVEEDNKIIPIRDINELNIIRL